MIWPYLITLPLVKALQEEVNRLKAQAAAKDKENERLKTDASRKEEEIRRLKADAARKEEEKTREIQRLNDEITKLHQGTAVGVHGVHAVRPIATSRVRVAGKSGGRCFDTGCVISSCWQRSRLPARGRGGKGCREAPPGDAGNVAMR